MCEGVGSRVCWAAPMPRVAQGAGQGGALASAAAAADDKAAPPMLHTWGVWTLSHHLLGCSGLSGLEKKKTHRGYSLVAQPLRPTCRPLPSSSPAWGARLARCFPPSRSAPSPRPRWARCTRRCCARRGRRWRSRWARHKGCGQPGWEACAGAASLQVPAKAGAAGMDASRQEASSGGRRVQGMVWQTLQGGLQHGPGPARTRNG